MGERGMEVTDDQDLAARMKLMSLHRLSRDVWGRFRGSVPWFCLERRGLVP
jgi:hypothetical protein